MEQMERARERIGGSGQMTRWSGRERWISLTDGPDGAGEK
jgi:hypothetical protein